MYLSDLLTEEQNDIRHMIRKFVDKEIMPIREKLEEDYGLVESVLQKLGGNKFPVTVLCVGIMTTLNA